MVYANLSLNRVTEQNKQGRGAVGAAGSNSSSPHGTSMSSRKRFEMVTVCVNYSDFLEVTLPLNRPHFDNIVVVTSMEDYRTQEVCRRFSTKCYATDLFYKDGAKFAKARGIDFGMSFLRGDSWIVHMDADVALPSLTRWWLNELDLDEECIYGIDRVNVNSHEEWKKHLGSDHCPHDYHCRIRFPQGYQIGDRIAIPNYGSFIPIGFWQLFHAKHGRRYPIEHGDAERTDVLHAIQWPSRNRRLIPEIIAIHLQSEQAKLGANWSGRTTKEFGK